jgi:hypothetical protein
MFLLDDLNDQIIGIRHILFIDTFTKQSSSQMRKLLDDNSVPYTYYYYSRDGMPDEVNKMESLYAPNTFPMVIVDAYLETSEYLNKIDEDGEYVFEEKEDGYIYPVLEEIKSTILKTVVYDSYEKLNNSRLIEKVSELGVKDVTEEN